MNRCLAAFLLLLSSGMFSGCIFGRKTHSSAIVANNDSTIAAHTADTMKIAGNTITLPGAPSIVTDTTASINGSVPHTTIDTLTPQQTANGTTLWHQPFAYNTFEGKAKMHYEGNGSANDFTANFRIKKDSVIWVFVNALGGFVPVARAYITPDSIKLINYLTREVTLMPIDQANRLLPAPVNFTILENLITGQPLLSNGSVTNVADSVIAWMVAIIDHNYRQQLIYTKSDSALQNQQMTTASPSGPKVSVLQTNYIREDRLFSRSRAVHIDNNGAQYELNMDFMSQSFNRALDFPFSYSSKYAVNPVK
jgi:hypothetical protein